MKKEKKQKITKEMTFSQLLKEYPEASKMLLEEGMMCVGCPMSMQETIEQGCKAHGINVNKLLKKLNKKAK
ncbi:MAG: DUF1858 domain-containing protein [Candidatus Pacearchaeota archaeon]